MGVTYFTEVKKFTSIVIMEQLRSFDKEYIQKCKSRFDLELVEELESDGRFSTDHRDSFSQIGFGFTF